MKKIFSTLLLVLVTYAYSQSQLLVNGAVGTTEICVTEKLDIEVPPGVLDDALSTLSTQLYDINNYAFAFVVNTGLVYDDIYSTTTDASNFPSLPNIDHGANFMTISPYPSSNPIGCDNIEVTAVLYVLNQNTQQMEMVYVWSPIDITISYPMPSGIIGANNISLQNIITTYTTDQFTNATYTWEVPFGWQILSGQGTNTITIQAASGRPGIVSVDVDIPNSPTCWCDNKMYVATDCWEGVVQWDRITNRMVSGDFDNDGVDDVAALHNSGLGDSKWLVWKGNELGGFDFEGVSGWWNTQSYYDADKVTGRVVAGDFNNDDYDDVAALYDYGNGETRIHVWLSTGSGFQTLDINGWWASQSWYNATLVTDRVVAGDFNNDGKTDIAAMYDYTGGARIHFFKNTGGGFASPDIGGVWAKQPYNIWSVTNRIVAGNFDGYEGDDIVAIQAAGNGNTKFHAWYSTGSANGNMSGEHVVWTSPSYYDANKTTGRVVAADFNQDGKDDIAAMYEYYLAGEHKGRIHVWTSQGQGAFNNASIAGWWASDGWYETNRVKDHFLAGDFDGDNAPDITGFYRYSGCQQRAHVFKGKKVETEPGTFAYGGEFIYQGNDGWWRGCPCSGRRKTSEEEQLDSEIDNSEAVVFPNPASSTFSIQGINELISEVRIVSLDAKVVHRVSPAEVDRNLIDISALPAGMYMVEITKAGNSKKFKKLAITR